MVEVGDQIIENEEKADYNPVSLLEEREGHRALIIEMPCEGKRTGNKQNVQQFDHPDPDSLQEALFFCFQTIVIQCNPLISHIEIFSDVSRLIRMTVEGSPAAARFESFEQTKIRIPFWRNPDYYTILF